MRQFNIGDRIIVADKTHIGAWPYRGKRGTVIEIHPDEPKGYTVMLMEEGEGAKGHLPFFLTGKSRMNPMPNEQELVEEVRLIMCEECSEGPERYGYQADLDMPACEGGAETVKLCNERARKIIACIARGPLPGEMGRGMGQAYKSSPRGLYIRGEIEMALEFIGEHFRLIALCKEEE